MSSAISVVSFSDVAEITSSSLSSYLSIVLTTLFLFVCFLDFFCFSSFTNHLLLFSLNPSNFLSSLSELLPSFLHLTFGGAI
ncbi:hypothetical protein HanRHA438_Chr07g0301081 [Helianthus annuus]|nr:hypothetical protein HanRHA438_Chr07g0301081 [Helianthus annuus]